MFTKQNKNFFVTFTGIDEFTNLAQLPKENVEYGILFSMHNTTSRYPSLEKIEKMSKTLKDNGYHLSLHVCGSEAKKMLINKNLGHFINNFERIQVNGKIKEEKAKIISELYKGHQILFQYNEENKNLANSLKNIYKNIAFLLDNSGGRGVLQENWYNPDKDYFFGYAGGLSPENISDELNKIIEISNPTFWIDMEGKIRTEDKFDIEKIKSILNKIEKLN